MRIEDYGLIGDLQTAALVGLNGSIDWLCFPRFDSGACFAALLGDEWDGRWLLAPDCEVLPRRAPLPRADARPRARLPHRVGRRPRDRLHAAARRASPTSSGSSRGSRASVPMRMELVIRFDYGSIVPWVRRVDDETRVAIAGPDALALRTPVADARREPAHRRGVHRRSRASACRSCSPGTRRITTLPPAIDAEQALERHLHVLARVARPAARYDGRWEEAVTRSLMVLKALTYEPTGGIVAAPTTSLPEQIGGVRNWDYRYCWLRDATFALDALLESGFEDEAQAWRSWLLRAVAGDPDDLQIMYGPAGERRLPERELPWLHGLRGVEAGPGRQRRQQPVPARRLRRGDRRPPPGAAARDRAGRRVLGAPAGAAREPRAALARAGRGHLGGARAAPPLHPLEGDGVGRVRPGGEGGRGLRPRGRRRALAAGARRDPRRGARARLRRGARLVRPVLRLEARSTRAC